MYNLTQTDSSTQTINLSNDTFIIIDKQAGFVSINTGQRTGSDQDWGGAPLAWLTLEQAEQIASVLYQPFSDPSLNDVRPDWEREDYVGV